MAEKGGSDELFFSTVLEAAGTHGADSPVDEKKDSDSLEKLPEVASAEGHVAPTEEEMASSCSFPFTNERLS